MYNNSFNSNNNKKILWQLLYENNSFNNIPENQFNNVKNIFEDQINLINNDTTSTLTEKNKKLIKQMINQVEIFKINKFLKPLEEVEIKISKDFANTKEEMMNLLKKPTQDEIDFTEGIDNPIKIEEMDSILSEMIKKRNGDIKISPPYKNKKVDFNLDNTNNINDLVFLNKLKKQDNTLDNTIDILKIIL